MVRGKELADEAIDFLSLDGNQAPEAPEVTTEETPALPVEPAPAAAAQPENPAPEPVQPPAVPAAQPGFVPLSAVLDEREKRQALEKQLQELQRKQQPVQAPSATSDPAGWAKAQEEKLAKFELDTKMRMSGAFAMQAYGQEAVNAAKAWGAQQNANDPYFGAKFTAQDHPWQWLVDQHRQAQTLERLGSKSPEDWALEYAMAQGFVKPDGQQTQQQPAPAPAAASPQPQPRPTPPRSIASVPPAGGTAASVTLKEDELLGDIFK
jgi:hypothetical protein